jgi:hypothetical protein
MDAGADHDHHRTEQGGEQSAESDHERRIHFPYRRWANGQFDRDAFPFRALIAAAILFTAS